MSGNAWVCDRCQKISRDGTDSQKDGPIEPPNWRRIHLPVRGSGGARSTRLGVICDDCDDSLYEWMHGTNRTGTTAQGGAMTNQGSDA